jgi:formylglycine-generating enzyme required for sulfatase activity
MMYCERCNIDFTEGLRYCKWCGQTLIERHRDTSELQTCPNCAAAVQPKWAFCKACGVRLASVAREPASQTCPQCGAVAAAGALHCLNCGQHLRPGDEAVGEAPSTSIIALCPTCGERIDPGSVYCKGCGAALYEQQTPFGQSAIICTACQSFNPVGSTNCRVCGASLVVTSGVSAEDDRATQVVGQRESNTLPDLSDHLQSKASGERRTPTAERASEPPHSTQERVSPPPALLDSGAHTLTFNSPGAEAFQQPGTEGFDVTPVSAQPPQPAAPPHAKGNDTSMLPGVAGSKFEQPPPTAALHMNRDTGPVEGEAESESEEAAPIAGAPLGQPTPSAELNKPAAPVTRIDSAGLAGHTGGETFTFISDIESASAPEGTIALGTNTAPPAAFEGEPRSSSGPFAPPAAPVNPPTVPISPVNDTDRVAPQPTQVIPSPTIEVTQYDPTKHATAPISQAPTSGQSNVGYTAPQAPVATAVPATPKKSRTGLLLGIIAALFVVGLLGGAAWWFLSGRNAAKPTATVTQTETPTATPKTEEPPKPLAPAAPEGMVMVAAGDYPVGRDDGSDLEKPQHTVTLPAYFIDRTEVTNEAYKKFVDATSHKPPANWQDNTYPTGRANYPVTGVTWQDAADYAAWAGKRLPTEAEWEAAARGPQGLRYPWGNEWLPGQANIGVKAGVEAKDNEYPPQIMEVGGFPQGASPSGALDMIGNVWEFTADELKVYPGNPLTLDDVAKKLNFQIAPGATYRVIRGGAFDGSEIHNASYRGRVSANLAYPKTGFRCVKDVK